MGIIERILAKSRVDDGCWVWTGCDNGRGYGVISVGNRQTYVHRAMYEAMVAEIPPGLEIDHLCRRRRCVNPDHLDPVPPSVNRSRQAEHTPLRARCRSGRHPMTPENTYISPRGLRVCKACRSENVRRRRAAQKENQS